MIRAFIVLILCTILAFAARSQNVLSINDSSEVRIQPEYNKVSGLHRKLFGENYRKEWAAPTKLPVIKISDIGGGLKVRGLGGGHQSHSLHLRDSAGAEWVLRTVEKDIKGLAPQLIKGSIYEKWLADNFSAQHPYSALIVPVLAEALNVPHTTPVMGIVAPDKALGEFEKNFTGVICLLEKRDPYGKSDNTLETLPKLENDNDYRIDSAAFFRARLLDLLIADWGRHEDQWRWIKQKNDTIKNYTIMPRDRDQALFVNEGLLPRAVSKTSLLSFLEGFNPDYKDVNAFFINGRKLNQQFLNQYTYDEWMQMTRDFVSKLPDDVLLKAVNQLPVSSRELKQNLILQTLKSRRDNLVKAMDSYYRFLYKIVDVRASDKNEVIQFNETPDGKLMLTINKRSKSGNTKDVLFSNSFDPAITKEIRLFSGKGNDVLNLNIPSSDIKLRIVGGEGQKNYNIEESKTKVHVYENLDNDSFSGQQSRLIKHLSNDSLNIRKAFTDLYANSKGFSPTADLRSVDGFFLGLGYRIKQEGFRKEPYGHMHKLSVLKSFNSKAVIIKYESEWKSAFKNTDFRIRGNADINGNIINFFGRGNDTFFNRTGDHRVYYRANFSWYEFEPSLNFQVNNFSLSAGPSFQYAKVNAGDNTGRYINTPAILNQFNNLQTHKVHGGLFANLNWDNRDNKTLPGKGINFNVRVQGFEGLNKSSDAFAQVFPQLSFYKSLDAKSRIVIAERIGAGFTFGTTAFYQSAFLGSQDNLLGFRKYRFAGDNLVYNNLEARITLPNFLHFFLPGKIGLIGFYDTGRVWIENDTSNTIHHGYGGGVFLNLFNSLFVRGIAGFSNEGMQPTVTLRQRF